MFNFLKSPKISDFEKSISFLHLTKGVVQKGSKSMEKKKEKENQTLLVHPWVNFKRSIEHIFPDESVL